MADDFGARLNRAGLARALGRSLPGVDAMVARGCPYLTKPIKRGVGQWEFDLADVVDWLIKDTVDKAVSERIGDFEDARGITLENARRDKVVAETRLVEIELAKARGELVAIDDAEKAVTDMISAARAKLIGLPAKLAPLVALKRKQAECKSIIEDDIFEALVELSEFSIDGNTRDGVAEVPVGDGAGVEPLATAAETDSKPVGRPRKKAKS